MPHVAMAMLKFIIMVMMMMIVAAILDSFLMASYLNVTHPYNFPTT